MNHAQDHLRAALRPGLSREERSAQLYLAAAELGVSERFWPAWLPKQVRWPTWLPGPPRWAPSAPRWPWDRFSMALVPFKLILLSRALRGSELEAWRLGSLAHELTHAQRAGGFFSSLVWLTLYLIVPPYRRDEEIEADAWGIAMRARVDGFSVDSKRMDAIINENAEEWSGMRPPYFCWGSLEKARERLLVRVSELLEE